jgi:flavin-dependent dehydrogenase
VTFDFDIVIVGGGPAGTSTALHLVRRERIAGRRIALIEKARHPRDKPCAGAVSAWGLEALASIGVALTVPHAVMRGLRVLAGPPAPGHSSRSAAPSAPPEPAPGSGPSLGAVVRRCEFDASLWRQAAADGAVVWDGEPLVAIAREDSGFVLETPARRITSRLVAACDGAGSRVRKLLAIPEAARKGHLYVAETALLPDDTGPRAGLCDFDLRIADEGIEGYYWDFPAVIDGALAVSRGIYHANFTPRSDVKAALGRALRARGLDIGALVLKPFSTRPLVPASCFSQNGLVLVGEAAGIDQTTGEGIAQAILTGAVAARHLARALRTGDASLEGYGRDVLRSRVGRHLLQAAWLARRVYGPRGAGWRAFLAGNAAAQQAGARWYAGKPAGARTKARLGMSLGAALAAAAFERAGAALVG